VANKSRTGFAVWLTGLPASGKSSIAKTLKIRLAAISADCEVIESDALREILTPQPRYDDEERDLFYRQVVYIGELLIRHGVAVIFDATANRRIYRERARRQIPKFFEVYVSCPLEVCIARDPKGIYRTAAKSGRVPGVQADYEPPRHPELVVRGDTEAADSAADRIIAALIEKEYLG
jgi:adenylylsulfate kinase